MKHPDEVTLSERNISDYFPMPGISLILASFTWIIFSIYFVAMLKDHCHRVKEMRRLNAMRKRVKGDVVDRQDSLRNSLRNPLLSTKEEKKEAKSKENLSRENVNTPEKTSAERTERTDKTDKNANPSAERVSPSKEVIKGSAETGDIKPSAELIHTPDKSTRPCDEKGETNVSPSKEMISPSVEQLNNETKEETKTSKEMMKEPKSDGATMTYSEMMKKEKEKTKSVEPFKETVEGRTKRTEERKTWQVVKHKPSAELIEEKWREEKLGGKRPTAAKEMSKEPAPIKKKEICASSENIVVTASAEHI